MEKKQICALHVKKHVKIYKLHKLGLTNKEIAEAVGTNVGHVWNVLNNYKNDPKFKREAGKIGAETGNGKEKAAPEKKETTDKVGELVKKAVANKKAKAPKAEATAPEVKAEAPASEPAAAPAIVPEEKTA